MADNDPAKESKNKKNETHKAKINNYLQQCNDTIARGPNNNQNIEEHSHSWPTINLVGVSGTMAGCVKCGNLACCDGCQKK